MLRAAGVEPAGRDAWFGVATSRYGREYRLGYGLNVFEGGGMSFDLGFDAQRRKSPAYGGADHGALARLTASW